MLDFLICPLRFHLVSNGLACSQFSGSLWHGALGRVLAEKHPTAFESMYNVAPEARLYAICPPQATHLPAGEPFTLGLTLFGSATAHAHACVDSILRLATEGLGYYGQFEVVRVEWLTPNGEKILLEKQYKVEDDLNIQNLQDYLIARQFLRHRVLKIELITPLCIKEANEPVRQAPSLLQILKRVRSRAQQIQYACRPEFGGAKADMESIFPMVSDVHILHSNVKWVNLERTSARSGQHMGFGGLVGDMLYQGPLDEVMPWLHITQYLQLGGKTAFGFGGIRVNSFAL